MKNFTELKGEIAGPPDTPYEGSVAIFISLLYCWHDVWRCMNAVVKMTIYKLFFTIGGRFQLEIKIPETYPFNPPKVILFLML